MVPERRACLSVGEHEPSDQFGLRRTVLKVAGVEEAIRAVGASLR
jgi:hypothetical protein